MKKVSAINAIISISLLLSGCVRYYNISDVDYNYYVNITRIDGAIKKINEDYTFKMDIYKSIITTGIDPSSDPYPSLKRHLESMSVSIDKISIERKNAESIRNEFLKVSSGYEKIYSNVPEWDRLQDNRDKFNRCLAVLKDEFANYESFSKQFEETGNKGGIVKLDMSDISKKIIEFTKRENDIIAQMQGSIKKARNELDKAESGGFSRKKAESKREILVDIELLLVKIEKEKSEVTDLHHRIRKEAGSRTEFWTGPGMISHRIILELKKKGEIVTGYENECKSLIAKYDRIN